MRLSQATEEQKRMVLAEMDGYRFTVDIAGHSHCWRGEEHITTDAINLAIRYCPKYYEDYNAIIRLIQKMQLSDEVEDTLWTLFKIAYVTDAEPGQLADALLVAARKLTP